MRLLISPSPRSQDTLGAAVVIKHQVNMVGRTWLLVLQVRSSKALSTFTSPFARKTFPPSSLGKKWYHVLLHSHTELQMVGVRRDLWVHLVPSCSSWAIQCA